MPAAATLWLSDELAGLRARADHSTTATRPMPWTARFDPPSSVLLRTNPASASSPVPARYASPSHALSGILPVCDGDSGLAGKKRLAFSSLRL